MDSPSDTTEQPSPPGESLGSSSVSDSHTTTHSDQLEELLKFVEDVALGRLRLSRDDEPIEFTISTDSWFELQYDSNFDLCAQKKFFRTSFDSSRSLVTVIPPPSDRHEAVVGFFSDLAVRTDRNLIYTRNSMLQVRCTRSIPEFVGDYTFSEKVPDLTIQWDEGTDASRIDTVLEVGVSQSLNNLRTLVPKYLKGTTYIQRVILIKMKEGSRLPEDPFLTNLRRRPTDFLLMVPLLPRLPDTPLSTIPTFPFNETLLSTGPPLPSIPPPTSRHPIQSPATAPSVRAPTLRELYKDEFTGAIWLRNSKVVGAPTLFYEVWERDTNGEPFKAFEETVAYRAAPSKDLPFFRIPQGVISGGAEVSVKPEKIKEFWTRYWDQGSMADARRRVCEQNSPVARKRVGEISSPEARKRARKA
ncbi:hypothetical protein AYL99_11969 [Fonsecaea erecta]|uniref:Uncharacterized protein n=1 Tax=Fonsecaea erecta TaxID=1367422 RepID=A0A178Z356_9EURO|nr:hypothetical protein AYL99_11969 [Fonsecaea erecta]OAP53846.1 hypothetical protein AYL99_11969 [Fonsecaea erecta]